MKFHVIGLGPSVRHFPGAKEGEYTIGVNDSFRHLRCDYLVVCDAQRRFDKERLHQICMSNPLCFFSNIPSWKNNSLAKFFSQVTFRDAQGECTNLDPRFPDSVPADPVPQYTDRLMSLGNVWVPVNFDCPQSNSSPFVAACIAYKLGATEIVLWGCDYHSHPVFSDKQRQEKVKKHFSLLKNALSFRGVKVTVPASESVLYKVFH